MSKEKEQLEKELQEQLLKSSYEKILQLELQLEGIKEKEIKFRDKVAMECFIALLPNVTDWQTAATDAYIAADVFLRIREGKDVVVTNK